MSALAPLTPSDAKSAALCFANHPNGVADVYVTWLDGTVTNGWYASRIQLSGGPPIVTLTSRPEAPPRPSFDLDFSRVAHMVICLSDGDDVEFGWKPPKNDPNAKSPQQIFDQMSAVASDALAHGRVQQGLDAAFDLRDAMNELVAAEHPLSVAATANYGEALRLAGRLNDAERELGSAVERARHVFAASDPNLARALSSLATVYFDRGDYARAEPLYREALDAYRGNAANSGDIAEMLNSLGLIALRTGNLQGADRLFRQAIDMLQSLGQARSRTYGRALHNLAVCLAQAGDLGNAGTLFHQALQARRAIFGDAHLETAESLASLGTFHYVQGQWQQAEPVYKQALAITSELLGDHLTTAERCMDVALCVKQKRTFEAAQEAHPLLKRAYVIRRARLGEDHPATQSAAKELFALERALGIS